MVEGGNNPQEVEGSATAKLQEEVDEDKRRLELRDRTTAASESFDDVAVDSIFSTAVKKKEKSIQKAQKFSNKLRRFDESDIQGLLDMLETLDVSMFVSEIADAIAEVQFKQRNVPSVVALCVKLHTENKEFSSLTRVAVFKTFNSLSQAAVKSLLAIVEHQHSLLLGTWQVQEGEVAESEDTQRLTLLLASLASIPSDFVSNLNRRKVLLRLMCELHLVNILQDDGGIISFFRGLCMEANEVERLLVERFSSTRKVASITARIVQLQSINVLESVVKKLGLCFIGSKSRRMLSMESAANMTVEIRCMNSRDMQKNISALITDLYHRSGAAILRDLWLAQSLQETLNLRMKVNKGKISAEAATSYEAIKIHTKRTTDSLESIADVLHLPELEVDLPAQEENVTRFSAELAVPQESTQPEVRSQWESAIDRSFYVDIINLADVIPAAFLGLKGETPSAAQRTSTEEGTPDAGDNLHESEDSVGRVLRKEDSDNVVVVATEDDELDKNDEKTTQTSLIAMYIHNLMQVLEEDAGLDNVQGIDKVAGDFFYQGLNTKANRKKLVQALLSTRRIDLHLLPAVCRYVATIAPFAKDVATALTDATIQEFKDLVAEKNPTKIESKIKNVTMIGEMSKFGLIPAGVTMDLFNQLLNEFSNHHVQMACHLVQSCGRYLMFGHGTSERFDILMSKMMKLSNAYGLSVDLEVLVQDTFFRLKTAREGRRAVEREALPVLQHFIHYVIFERLMNDVDGQELNACLRDIRRLDWSDPQVYQWIKGAILSMDENLHFDRLDIVAEFVMRLAKYKRHFVIDVVDTLLEDIQICMEHQDFREKPQQNRQLKFLAELFNMSVISVYVLLDVLYHLLGFGTSSSFGCSRLRTTQQIVSLQQKLYQQQLNNKKHTTDESGSYQIPLPFPHIMPGAPDCPWWDDSRMTLVAMVLTTIAETDAVQRGMTALMFDRFLLFYQRYIFMHKKDVGGIGINLRHIVNSALLLIRPKMLPFPNVEELDKHLVPRLEMEAGVIEAAELALSELEQEAANIDEEFRFENEDGTAEAAALEPREKSEEEEDEGGEVEDFDEWSCANGSDYEDDSEVDSDDESSCSSVDLEVNQFEREMACLVMEAIEDARSNSVAVGKHFDMRPMPTAAAVTKQLEHTSKSNTADADTSPLPNGTANLRLVTRKGQGQSKFKVRQLVVPTECRLVTACNRIAEEDEKEKLKLKQFVFDSLDRSQQEGMIDLQRELLQGFYSKQQHQQQPDKVDEGGYRGSYKYSDGKIQGVRGGRGRGPRGRGARGR